MPTGHTTLSPQAISAIQNGNLLEAIKIVRGDTGLGLKEAKELVEQYRSGKPLVGSLQPGSPTPQFGDQLPPAARAALSQGNIIEAIKQVRAETGLGLKEAKDLVERHQSGKAPASSKPRLGSGQVAESRFGAGFWLAVILGGALLYLWFSGSLSG
ncbi:hypothetical protein GCM10007907_21690 [Chitinimonas prasina]|uniref:Large ribosomal subunit protein bL12 C-terminal domain-containing protein n=1 Tax=Chitinimonas prasina TaxID=1434937 RepID=A0ABQ5YKB3_9NEIS|nr:ribosomal protein L7/L12 [Chitinimonas prasina]GLR13379.1 hypothetical protein GCM10007907_21690 [Chitinimonas prasina]